MKNLFKLFVPMAAAVIATTACQQEAIAPQQAHVLNITVKASPDEAKTEAPASKTYIEGTKILWGPGEYMLIGVNDGTATVFGTSKDDYADDFEGEDQAWFAFSITPATESGDYTYYGLYPAAAAVESTDPTQYKVNLPAQQSASATSYDPKAYILVARPESGKTEAEAEDWVAYFRRATALNKITLSNLPEDIKRVTITVPEGVKMAGRRKFDLTTGASGEIYYGETNTIEVSYSTKLSHEASMDIWFTSWAAEVKEGEDFTVSAVSDDHIYTRTITLPAGRSISFKEGYLNTLSIDMTSAVVEDNKELAAGNYVIVAKNGNPASYYAVKAAANGTRIASQDYTGSIDSYEGEGSIVWAVSQESGSYIIANSGKYIGYKGSSNEAYWLEPGEDWTATNYLVDIVWDKTNSCYHVALHNNSNRVFQRNSGGSNYFAFYTSNQQKDLLFIPATVDERTPVTLSFAESEVNLTTAEVAGFEGQAIVIDPSEATATVSSKLSWKLEDASGIVTSLESGVVTLNGNTGSATVSASFAGDETYMPAAEVSYTINVTSGVTPVSGWIETELSSISAGDVFVMVGNGAYALSSAGSTSSNPPAVAVTVSGNKLTSDIADAIKWNLSGNATDGYTFYPNGASTKLFCNTTATSSSNANLRVGDGGNYNRILFELTDGNQLVTKDDYTARYIGINGSSDFRGYVSASTNKVTFKFYKWVDSREEPGMEWSAASATASFATGNNLSFTAPTLNPGNATGITYASTDETIATINASGEVTITALVGNTVNTGSTTIKAIFNGDATYSAQTVSYTLTVEDNRAQVATPTFSPAEGEVAANTEVSFNCTTDGVTFYYTLNNTTPTTESTKGASVTITEGKTVKVIATKTGYKPSEVASATYTISGATPNDGSLEHPYTASEAKALAIGGDTGSYYISGIVTNIKYPFTSGYGTATFWIDENGTAQDVFQAYSVKYIGNKGWVDGNAQIALNDEVIIYGTLTLYNETAEATDGYLVSVNGITKALTVPTLTATPDNDKKQITVTWGAAEGTESAISYAVTCGTQNYNASAAGSHTFTMADYGTYDVSVVVSAADALSATASTSATLTDPSSETPSPETITFADLGLTNGVQYSDPFDGGHFTIQFAGGSNDGKYYTTGAGIRTYGGGSFTITSTYTISEILFTWDGSYAPTADVASPSGYSTSTKKWTGEATTVTLSRPSGSGHWRLKSVKVTYK